jgi:hypothetical protein
MNILTQYNRFLLKHINDSNKCLNCNDCIKYISNIYHILPGKITMINSNINKTHKDIFFETWIYNNYENYYTSKLDFNFNIIYPYEKKGLCYNNISGKITISFEIIDDYYYPVHLERVVYDDVLYKYLLFSSKHLNVDRYNIRHYFEKIYKILPGKLTIIDDYILPKINVYKQNIQIDNCNYNITYYYPYENKIYSIIKNLNIEYNSDKNRDILYPISFLNN